MRREFEAGQFLFRAGDAGDTLNVLAHDNVSIKLLIKRGGDSKSLVTLSPGVMFGEMVLIESRPRSADAVTDKFTVDYGLNRGFALPKGAWIGLLRAVSLRDFHAAPEPLR